MRRLADDHPASAPVFRPSLPIPSSDDTTASLTDPVLCPFSASARVDEKAAATSLAKQVVFVRSVEQRLEGPVTGPPDRAQPLSSKSMSVGELRYTAEDEAGATAAGRQQAQQLLALKKVQWDVIVVGPTSCSSSHSQNRTHRLHACAASRCHRHHLTVLLGNRIMARDLSDLRLQAVGYVSRSRRTKTRTALTAVLSRRSTEVAYFLVPWMFVIGVDVALTLLLLNVVRHFVPTDSFLARVLGQGSKNRRGASSLGLFASDELDSLTMASSAADPADQSTRGVETVNDPPSGTQTTSA